MDEDPSPSAAPRLGFDIRVSSAVGRLPVARGRIADVAARVLRGERAVGVVLTVTFVSGRAIARLNRRHLGHAGETDIITLEHVRGARGGPRVGDVYIAVDVARRNARAARCSVREEVVRLTIHGVLHTLGWDHPGEGDRLTSPMWRRQESWVQRLRQAGQW